MQSLIAVPHYFTNDVFPTFQKPKIIGFFSLDAKRNYKPDASQLKFLPKTKSEKVSYDLSHNLAQVIRKDGSDPKLTNLLEFIYRSKPKSNSACYKVQKPQNQLPYAIIESTSVTYSKSLKQTLQLQKVQDNKLSKWRVNLSYLPALFIDLLIIISLPQSRNKLHTKNPEETSTLEAAPFHCYRGLLTLIAASPYEKDPWKILATLYNGNIYLCAVETEQQKERIRNLTERDLKFMSWGFKFEQYVLADSPNGQPDISSPVNENEEFNVVFRTKLGQHRLLYGAEMDGIRADRTQVNDPPDIEDVGEEGFIEYLSKHEFIELKTSRLIETSKQQYTFKRYKLLKWWLQSFLVGIGTVISGFRDDHGRVRQLTHYEVREMPKIAAGTWKPNVCFSFCNKFLTFVKNSFTREISKRYGDSCDGDLTKIHGEISILFECREDGKVVITDNYRDSDKILPEWFLGGTS